MSIISSVNISISEVPIIRYSAQPVPFKVELTDPSLKDFELYSSVIYNDETEYANKATQAHYSGSTDLIAKGFIGETTRSSSLSYKVRVWTEDPSINPNAPFVDSNVVYGNSKLIQVTNGPKPRLELYIKSPDSGPSEILIEDAFVLDRYDINKIKIHDPETGFVFFEPTSTWYFDRKLSCIILNETSTPTSVTPPIKFLVCDIEFFNTNTGTLVNYSSVVSSLPRFFTNNPNNSGSSITGIIPFKTVAGDVPNTIPLMVYPDGTNLDETPVLTKTVAAYSGYSIEETRPNFFTADAINNLYYRKQNNLSSPVLLQSNAVISGAGSTFGQSGSVITYVTPRTESSNEFIIDEEVPGQFYSGNFDPTNVSGMLARPTEINTGVGLKIKSMPPITIGDSYYEIDLIDDSIIRETSSPGDYVVFFEVSTYGDGPVFVSDSKIALNTFASPDIVDMYTINIKTPAIWYPNETRIDMLQNPAGANIPIVLSPLIKTGFESIEFQPVGYPKNGESFSLYTIENNFSNINTGITKYEWFKNGYRFNHPGINQGSLSFEKITLADEGTYTLRKTISPRGIKAADSDIVVEANYVISVSYANQIKTSLKVSDTTVLPNVPIIFTGEISIQENTIVKTELSKIGEGILREWGNELSLTHTIENPTEEDYGIYVLRTKYLDDTTTIITHSNNVTLSDNSDMEEIPGAAVSITGPSYGLPQEEVTFTAKITASDEIPKGTEIKYYWYLNGNIISDATSDTLSVITENHHNATYSVEAYIHGFRAYKSVLVKSPEVKFLAKVPDALSININSNKDTAISGSEIELNLTHSTLSSNPLDFEWYKNGVLIENSKNVNPLKVTIESNSSFYAKGIINDPAYISKSESSNILRIKAIPRADSINVDIDGPDKARVGDKVILKSRIEINSLDPVDLTEYVITWYKDNVLLSYGENIEFIASADTFGDYSCEVMSAIESSVYKSSPIKTITEQEDLIVSVTIPSSLRGIVGDTITIQATIVPVVEGQTLQWSKDGTPIEGAVSNPLILNNVEISAGGSYTLTVTTPDVAQPEISNAAVLTINTSPAPALDGDLYFHDLNPGRDAGFTWFGWWVIDEIDLANKEGFDWRADPYNTRFKYSREIAALSSAMDKWPAVEVQESRNGYILRNKDFE